MWHEKWGEDYAKEGDFCVKYTDRWSEKQMPDGRQATHGDKWREEFGSGSGNKTGETWHVDPDGHRCALRPLSLQFPSVLVSRPGRPPVRPPPLRPLSFQFPSLLVA